MGRCTDLQYTERGGVKLEVKGAAVAGVRTVKIA